MLSRVSPFRDLRIKGHLHLPAAFRSLLRLSSALSAKASTLRSCLLTIYVSDLRSSLTRVCSVIPPAVLDLFSRSGVLSPFTLPSASASGFVSFNFKFMIYISKPYPRMSYHCYLRYSICGFQGAKVLFSLTPWPRLMEMKRFELSTPCLQGRCSPN